MRAVRRWSVSHARFLNGFYGLFEGVLFLLRPVFRLAGWRRLERPTRFVERNIKGFMFDCQMCGQCALSRTGMSCPMNCPKSLRNGPCGGVRPDGNCEVKPDMPCVWVEAWRGAMGMGDRESILTVEAPVDHRQQGSSSWLRVAREETRRGKGEAG